MDVEKLPTAELNPQIATTPLLDELCSLSDWVARERPLIERSVGLDGALIKNIQGDDALEAQKVYLALKLAKYINPEQLKKLTGHDVSDVTNSELIEALVDELVTSQDTASLPIANELLRGESTQLKSQLEEARSPDLEYLHNELARLQAQVSAQVETISGLEDTVAQERLKNADKDLLISSMVDVTSEQVTEQHDALIEVFEGHTITDELKLIANPVLSLGKRAMSSLRMSATR